MDMVTSTRAEQASRTRQALIEVGRRLFGEHGYNATGTHELVAAAQVTRGALCHHFPKKEDLFRSVFEEVQRSLKARVNARFPDQSGADRWVLFKARIGGFLDAAMLPEVHRILLLDGPSVLGWRTWQQLQADSAIGPIGEALSYAMSAGFIRRQRVEPLAQLVLAVMNQAALMLANADDPAQARTEVEAALQSLLFSMVDGARAPVAKTRTRKA